MSDPNPGLTLMSDPNANPDSIFLNIHHCKISVVVLTAWCLLQLHKFWGHIRRSQGMHFSSIVQKLGIPIVSHDWILLECSVYAGCIILHILHNSNMVSSDHAP